jgi:hypothetical protein
MFRYSSFVGTTNQIAKPARTNGTPLGKPCSSILRPENLLSGSCMRRRSPTNRTETMAVPNEDSSEAKLPYRPKDHSSFTGTALRGSGLLFAMWRDPQGDGRMRPGDWLVLLIGSALIIVTALEFLCWSSYWKSARAEFAERAIGDGDRQRSSYCNVFGARWYNMIHALGLHLAHHRDPKQLMIRRSRPVCRFHKGVGSFATGGAVYQRSSASPTR